jgi:2-keto-4-pentenoate hydratase/2-oxohepta-3-ene-1,7-dioic acid hydratase in catechol pathway
VAYPVAAHAGPFALGTFTLAGQAGVTGPAGRAGVTGPAGPAGFAGLVAGDRVRDLSEQAATVTGLLRDWDAAMALLGELSRSRAGRWLPLDELRPAPPVLPGQILQSGANYRQHVIDIIMSETEDYRGRTADEVRADAETLMDARAASGEPYLFIGLPSALCGARDDIVLPPEGRRHDWELELAVVIGRSARRVPRSHAMNVVAGYLICNDITSRDRVYRADLPRIGTDWLRAKNAPTFLPAGPYLVPAAFAGNPMDLRITLRHNGLLRQDASTKDMIFDIPALISYASTLVPLSPGDLLLTGSPAGNGTQWGTFLQAGDVIEAEITGLGAQRNRCTGQAPDA